MTARRAGAQRAAGGPVVRLWWRMVPRLAHPRAPLGFAVLAAILGAPALLAGFGGDDWLHRVRLLDLGVVPDAGSPWVELFDFYPGTPEGLAAWRERGFLPWWHHPEVQIHFFRPLAVLTHVLDYRLWPDAPGLHHAHSLLWAALAVYLVARTFRRLMPGAATAGLAGLLFAVEDAHAMPMAWIANRNALVGVALGAVALGAHVRWRRGEGRSWALLSAGTLLAAVLAAEGAVAVVAYLFAWQVMMERGAWGRRLAGLVPAACVLLPWRVLYRLGGFGVRGSGWYQDPVGDPWGYAASAVRRLPVLVLGQWAQVPMDAWVLLSREQQWGLVAAGLAVTAVLAWWAWRFVGRRPVARFWALGMGLSALLAVSAFPMDRQTLYVGWGAFGLLACGVEALGWLEGPERWTPRPLVRTVAIAALVAHLVGAAAVLPLRVAGIPRVFGVLEENARSAVAAEGVEERTVIYVTGSDLMATHLVLVRACWDLPVPRRVAVLSSALERLEVTREGPRTLRLRPEHGFLARTGDRMSRGRRPVFSVGERVDMGAYTVEVLSVTPGGRPAEVRVVFARPLEDSRYRWVVQRGGGVESFPLPGIGETVVVEPWRPGGGRAGGGRERNP